MGNLWNGCWNNYRLSYSRKKNRGVEDMKFPGLLKNGKWIFQGLIKNNVEFPGVVVLGLKISKGWKNCFWIFSGWSLVLSEISMGEVKKTKNSRGDFKKVLSSTPPVCFFSGIAHIRFMSEYITFIIYVEILLVSGLILEINGMHAIFQK